MRKAKTAPPKVIIGDGTLSKEEEERMALLIILHLGERQVAEGKVVPASEAFKRVRARLRQRLTKKK
jgi:hypothetical protein